MSIHQESRQKLGNFDQMSYSGEFRHCTALSPERRR